MVEPFSEEHLDAAADWVEGRTRHDVIVRLCRSIR